MFGIDSDSAGGNATRGSVSGEPGGGTGTDPQESNKNLAMGCTRRGEGAAVYRSSLPLVLALVVLMVLPAHGAAARPGGRGPAGGARPADDGRCGRPPRRHGRARPQSCGATDALGRPAAGPVPER